MHNDIHTQGRPHIPPKPHAYTRTLARSRSHIHTDSCTKCYRTHLEKLDASPHHCHAHHSSMPCVSELRGFFEQLSRDSQDQDRRCSYMGSPKRCVLNGQSKVLNGQSRTPNGIIPWFGKVQLRHRAFNISKRPQSQTLDKLTSELKKKMPSPEHQRVFKSLK